MDKPDYFGQRLKPGFIGSKTKVVHRIGIKFYNSTASEAEQS